MRIKEYSIENMTNEEKQLLYDAVVHYMFAESKIGNSNHFAADIHKEIAEEASKIVIRMREQWKELMH